MNRNKDSVLAGGMGLPKQTPKFLSKADTFYDFFPLDEKKKKKTPNDFPERKKVNSVKKNATSSPTATRCKFS